MKLTTMNLRKKDIAAYIELIEDIFRKEFPELTRRYKEICIIIGNTDDIRNNLFGEAEIKFFGNVSVVFLGKEIFKMRSMSKPPRACLEINLSMFELMESGEQRLAIRHECCHLLNPEKISALFNELKEKYHMDYLISFARYRREYCAHLCVIKRYPEDWLKKAIGLSKNMQSPRVFYYTQKRTEGKKAAVYWCILNMVHILSILYLYEHIPPNLKSKIKKKEKIGKRFMQEFFVILKNDTFANIPMPRKWLTPSDFLSDDTYFQKIQKLLMLFENKF